MERSGTLGIRSSYLQRSAGPSEDDGGYSYVFKQPTTPEEEALCQEAMEGCPVEAIGNDGEG